MSSASEYSQLDEITHVLECPDVYMGALQNVTKEMYTYDPVTNTVKSERVMFNTGLLKVFDEILTNAADNLQRPESQISSISVEIANDYISVTNDGRSIPIMRNEAGMWIPEMAFTCFRSGSNFRKQNKTTGGKNGIGAKLTTVFSSYLDITLTIDGHTYHQEVYNNCREVNPPTIDGKPVRANSREYDKHDYPPDKQSLTITFYPDFEKFKMSAKAISEDNKKVLYKRCHDLTHLNVNVSLNGVMLPKISWLDYVNMFNLSPRLYAYECDRWKVAFGVHPKKFHSVSYVNNITTYEDGEHVKYILNQLYERAVSSIPELADVSKNAFKSRLTLFVYSIIEDASYTSQAKEKLSTRIAAFGSTCKIPIKIIDDFLTLSDITDLLKPKPKAVAKVKKGKITDVEKLVEANKAGTKEGHKCTLFLCEGLSAKTMCDAGIGILGHDYYGCYPLRGKVLNSRKASEEKYDLNRELNDVKKIIGLTDGVEYDKNNINTLRYGKVVCVKDADSDGAAIMGLVINFFEDMFPSLLTFPGFFSEFISPMIKVIYNPNDSRKRKVIPFYNEVEYKRFITDLKRQDKTAAKSAKSFVVEFIKGLATNEKADVKEYFTHYTDNCINIIFDGPYTKWLNMVYGSKYADKRKLWLTTINDETHLPRNKGEPIRVIDFIKNDLVLFSYDNCLRSIPSVVDGLKPSQRKILYTLFKKGAKGFNKMKVFQLGGIVADVANYHHGEQSMNATIIGMAQTFTGSGNNLNLLQPFGSFGSRTESGKDSGAPRYISAGLSKVSRLLFPAVDDELTDAREEDNQTVEPYYYVPILPTILINGAKGIGTGWSTDIPSYNPFDLINYVRALLSKAKEVDPVRSFYAFFTGPVEFDGKRTHTYRGVLKRIDRRTYEVTELPIRLSTSKFIDRLNYLVALGELGDYETRTSKAKAEKLKEVEAIGKKRKVNFYPINTIESFENHCAVEKIRFVIRFVNTVEPIDAINTLGLVTTIKTSNMVAFDAENKIHKFGDIYEIIQMWYEVRYDMYNVRKEKLTENMKNELTLLDNKCRFIDENIKGIINVRNIQKAEIVGKLTERGYFKHYPKVKQTADDDDDADNTGAMVSVASTETGFDYLLNMKIYTLTKEHFDALCRKRDELQTKLNEYTRLTIEDIWNAELNELEAFLKTNTNELGLTLALSK